MFISSWQITQGSSSSLDGLVAATGGFGAAATCLGTSVARWTGSLEVVMVDTGVAIKVPVVGCWKGLGEPVLRVCCGFATGAAAVARSCPV